MKKSRVIVAVLLLSSFSAGAQFLYALGIAPGLSYGKEVWSKEQFGAKEKYLFGLNGSLLAEFFPNPVFKWRSEIMYNQLGTTELFDANTYINNTNYISFNNYLKIQHEFFRFMPYILIGPRVEYLFSRNASIFPQAINNMYKLHLSAAIGAGVELISYSRFKLFTEVFYNRDVMPSFSGNVNGIPTVIIQHDYEWRIGLKYVFKPRDKCPRVINPAGNPPGVM